jgi:hypothetical protein
MTRNKGRLKRGDLCCFLKNSSPSEAGAETGRKHVVAPYLAFEGTSYAPSSRIIPFRTGMFGIAWDYMGVNGMSGVNMALWWDQVA